MITGNRLGIVVSIPDRDSGEFKLSKYNIIILGNEVSIPDRDSGEFKQVAACLVASIEDVSIPDRDSGEFKLSVNYPRLTMRVSFNP